jgi:aminopeptidase
MLQRLAEVTLTVGVNLQPGQRLLVLAPIETAPLVRLINAEAYRMGSRLVTVLWSDEQLSLGRLEHSSLECLSEVAGWMVEGAVDRMKQGDAVVYILVETPGLLAAQDPAAVSQLTKAALSVWSPFYALIEENATNWVVICAATGAWAAQVFAGEPEGASLQRLWQTIFPMCRVDVPDPVGNWEAHVEQLAVRCKVLNQRQYSALHYSGPGTDLTAGLPSGHLWLGGRVVSRTGIPFVPNLPTEEVFTCPHRGLVNGVVAASRPFECMGTTIKGMTLTLREGMVVEASASAGEEVLTSLIAMDQGSCRLGEVALVPHSSPVSQAQLLFRNVLLDENAASHLALGFAYKSCVAGGPSMSDQEFEAAGGNTSAVHVDFMIGSEKLSVEGILPSGASEPVMTNGEWAFEL